MSIAYKKYIEQPTASINITNASAVDVTTYASAQVVDANLTAENIKKDVVVLGITGTHEGGGITKVDTIPTTKSTELIQLNSDGSYYIWSANITYNLTNCVPMAGAPSLVATSSVPLTLTFTANSGYTLPASITVTGATYIYTQATGTIVLSTISDDVVITITAA